MLFNSLEYLVFLPALFFLYWFVCKNYLRYQNILVLIASYLFYGWWDWRFLSLIFLSTLVDYSIGLKIDGSSDSKKRKSYLWVSIAFNLGLLGFFKYYNFFVDSWIDLLSIVGYRSQSPWILNVVLPVGISFYTFQTMSYSLDIYYKKLKPTRDFISFAAFVSFFPQLVAGPIERASNILPQMLSKRVFKYEQATDGLRLILWGMFKKIVIADSLGWRVDYCFNNFELLDGGTLLLGLVYFSVQIYCDFSGYSDIAIGTAKLFGFELMSNFKFPYFSRDMGEFWRRWHISLSSWFRDYLYIPLGGSQNGTLIAMRNIFIIFIASGFWHGANWTFIAWGLCHAILYIPIFLRGKNHKYKTDIVAENNWVPSLKEIWQMGVTFMLWSLAFAFFRSQTIADSFNYLYLIVSKFSIPLDNRSGTIFLVVIFIFEWTMRKDERKPLNFRSGYLRLLVNLVLFYFIFAHFKLIQLTEFIYFQF